MWIFSSKVMPLFEKYVGLWKRESARDTGADMMQTMGMETDRECVVALPTI
jgi:hypothetical protein